MGKLTISMAIFNSYVKLPEGTLGYTDIDVGKPMDSRSENALKKCWVFHIASLREHPTKSH